MNSPDFENSNDGPIASADQSDRVLYRNNLIYLPFASHLAEVDEAEEGELKAA